MSKRDSCYAAESNAKGGGVVSNDVYDLSLNCLAPTGSGTGRGPNARGYRVPAPE